MKTPKSDTPATTSLTRRDVITGTVKLGLLAATSVAAGNACSQSNESKTAGGLPPQGEYLIRGGYILSMDEEVGELDRGDVHVKDGAIVAVASEVSAPDAEVIDAYDYVLRGMKETQTNTMEGSARAGKQTVSDKQRLVLHQKSGHAPVGGFLGVDVEILAPLRHGQVENFRQLVDLFVLGQVGVKRQMLA